MTNPTSPPLWRVMQDAYFDAGRAPFSEPHGYAAEIRAIVKEASRRYEGNDPAISLIAWLEMEADRAEAGE